MGTVFGAFQLALDVATSSVGPALTVFGLGQSALYHGHDLQWSEIDYFLQVRQVHIETLDNMREDLLEMYAMDGRKLDTRMIVATLLLAMGFGFVVEGTFPATDPGRGGPGREVYKAQQAMRIVYAICAAMALLCPFWSMLAIIECRRRLDVFMDHFNDKFYRMLRHRFDNFQRETQSTEGLRKTNLVRYTKGLPEDCHPWLANLYKSIRCPRRRAHKRADRVFLASPTSSRSSLRNLHAPGDFDVILALHSHYATWSYQWCKRFQTIARVNTWLSMVCSVICCAVLTGMHFQCNYPDTPGMWQSYSYVVLAGLLVAMVCTGLAHRWGPRLSARLRHIQTFRGGMPDWMLERGWSKQPLLHV